MGTYKAKFKSIKNIEYNIEISASWLTDKTIYLDADPVHLVVSAGKTKFPGLRTTECEINVLSTDPMVELFSEDIMSVTVHMYHESVTDFIGFLETSEWDVPAAPGMLQSKQLVAVDALSVFLQKPCYERSFRSMLSIMDQLKTELNGKLPVTVSYKGSLLNDNQIYGAYVNIDSLQPQDLYAEQTADENWTSWGEIINEFAVATASTIMMLGNEIKAYYVDTETEVWCSQSAPMESRLVTTSMSLKMVNSVRRVENKVSTLQNLGAAEVISASGRYVAPGYPGWFVSNDFFKPAYYSVPDGLVKYWRKGSDWPSSIPADISAISSFSYSEEFKYVDRESKDWLIGINAESWPVHVVPEYSPTQIISVIDIEALVHINSYEESAKVPEFTLIGEFDLQYYPRLWKATAEETGTGSKSTIALRLGNKVIDPFNIILEDNLSSDNRDTMFWLKYRYSFNVNPADMKACDFKPVVIVRSPDYGNLSNAGIVTGYRWAKNIRLIGDGYSKDWEQNKTVSKVASGASTGNVLDLGCKFNQEYMYAGEIRRTIAVLRDPLQIHAAQYAVPRQQWQATVDDAGFDPTKKTWCRGSLCTQIASDWDVRNAQVKCSVIQ